MIIENELQFVSSIGDKNFLLPVLVVLLSALLYIYKFKKESILMFSTLLSSLISFILKNIFKVSRPSTATILFSSDKYSFPSTHVLVYTVIFGFIFYLTFKLKDLSKFVKFLARISCLYFISLVGISRVYLGQHWIKDVIAGYIIGLLLLGLLILMDLKLRRKNQKND